MVILELRVNCLCSCDAVASSTGDELKMSLVINTSTGFLLLTGDTLSDPESETVCNLTSPVTISGECVSSWLCRFIVVK